MTKETSYKDIPELVAAIENGIIAPVYLLYGDEFIYKSAFKSLLDAIVAPRDQDLNYESIDGASENVYDIIQRLNTFPLIPSAKVIAIHDTRLFYSTVVINDLLLRSKEAFETEDLRESAHYLLYTLSMAGVSLNDVQDENWDKISDSELRDCLRIEATNQGGSGWLGQVIAYCIQEKVRVPVHQDDADVLNDAILSGFPDTNHLILTTDLIDKRRKLYKTIKKMGVAIDCSMPKSDRKADRDRQQAALKAHMKGVLKKVGKTMAPGGFEALYERTGPNIRSFSSELNKVVTFVGGQKEILTADIETTSERTREDPIYEMSNAIAERDTHKALFFLGSLLKNNVHPLQVLAVVTNQIRKLILAKDFLCSKPGNSRAKDLSYAGFQKLILPELEKREPDLLTGNAHPYAIYMTLKQSHNYALEELTRALELLLDADIRLKTSGQHPKVVLENATLRICGDEQTFPSHISPSALRSP
jgi:DNA polymerase-3 subunit delta